MAKVSDAHLAARRRSIVVAACGVFSRKGVESATMAEIASEAGLSPGALYRYFENKEQLANSCMSENATDLEDQWKRTPDDSTDPLREFLELSRKTLGTLNDPDERTHTLLMLEHIVMGVRQGDADLDDLRAGFAKTREGIRQRLALAKANGQLPRGLDPELSAGALFSFYLGARVSKAVDSDIDTTGQLDQMLGLLRAISPAPVS
ncbi:MAG: TetR/AcrR family transcriptional regulator [Anaerolineaceae bacterium]